MVLKSAILSSVLVFCFYIFYGQSGFPYDAEWKLIDSLMTKKNLPKSALAEVNKVYAAAKREKQEAQWVKAIIYKNHLQQTEDRDINQIVSEMEKEIDTAPPRVAALLKSVEAEQLNQYLQAHRYELSDRTRVIQDTATDISTWSASRLQQKIRPLYLSSIENSRILLQTPLKNFDPILLKGNIRELRPTLYDLLAWRALDYFRVDDLEHFSSDDRLMENPVLFSEALFFMHYRFNDVDSLSNRLTAIKIFQQLLRFHAKDIRLDPWIDADINRIRFVYQYAQMPDKDSLYMNALGRITKQFPTLSVTAGAWYLEAQWWEMQAALYDPLKDSLHRFDYLQAIALCEQGIKNPDSSEGKSNCEQLLKNIRRSSYYIKTEQVNLPDQPFRLLVTYRNINRIYGRIIRTDDATWENFERNSDDLKSWTKMIHMPYVKNFQQAIRETSDYQQHWAEIKMEALPVGQYALLTSSDSVFSEKSILGLTPFFCSSLAFVKSGLDYFVLDRDSGHPLKGTKVKSFIQNYNGNFSYSPGKIYETDLHGHFRLIPDKRNSNSFKIEFHLGKDYLTTTDYISYYNNEDDQDNKSGQKAFEKKSLRNYIFTDRSIYRPGQTVYFKGILVTRDFKTRKYKIADQVKTKIFLVAVNNQKIDSLVLKSNDFGSIEGVFHLPQNLLNGEFTIEDGLTSDEQSFSVEEYKRPSFYVDYDSVRGPFRVGDTVQLKGTARAYAGNSIDAAAVRWRVYRESRFPYPWLFRYFPSRTEQEIANGESSTDADGKFYIRFKAAADKSISKSARPVYTYRIESTVTDANGESRTAVTDVSASYQSFEIISSLPVQGRMPADSLYEIPLTTKNASGVFIKEKITVSICGLKGPGRLIRKRYWEQPDQFVMTETDFKKAFPYDEYRNETDITSWEHGVVLYERTDSTRESGVFEADKNVLTTFLPGWYLLEFKARDKDGEEIVDKRYVELTRQGVKSGIVDYNRVPFEEISAEPKNAVIVQTGSDARDVFVIRARQGTGDTTTGFSFFNINQQVNTSRIEVMESDRGGFSLNDVFVKNNRWYTSQHNILVPWTNKELQIEYTTWKDKTIPGSAEQWKIKISGYKKDMVAAEVLTSMYDASLDQFRMHNWSPPDLYSVSRRINSWTNQRKFDDVNSILGPVPEYPENARMRYNYDELISPGYRNRVMFKAMNAPVQDFVGAVRIVKEGRLEDSAKMEMEKFTPPKIVNDEEITQEPGNKNPGKENIQIRRNFNETAFFQPELKTDAQGNVEISFTMTEALTRWKWMVMAHTKDLAFGYAEKEVVTQKELMLQTNMPRFFRQGDTILLPVKIANLSNQNMTGTVQLEWLDAMTNQPVGQALGNVNSSQPFTLNISQSAVVFFPAIIPSHFNQPLLYRIIAKTNMKGTGYSDGEEAVVPVLSNRMLVMESLPLNMGDKKEQHFVFEKLLKSGASSSLQNQVLTVEYTTNPAWWAVQSLPFLMEFPYECAEQTFNRFYANALAARIVNVSPAMQAVFEKWKNTDTAALVSNLQKNEELKSALLRETPWVLEAQTETEQKKNLGFLFDMMKMRASGKSALEKLRQMQSESGGFPWFKGGRDDRYITQYIISGIGRLRKLNAIPADLLAPLNKIARSAIAYLDKEIVNDYEKRSKSPGAENLDIIQIQWLYMRSFFPEIPVTENMASVLKYYQNQSLENWTKQSVYMQGMIALFLNRGGDTKTAIDILASLKETAINSPELGMYWKSVRGGYYWQEAPVETQSLLIETFQDLHAELKTIDRMKYWLLQQKHTQHWPTTKATADACYALLLSGTDWLSSNQRVTIQLGSYKVTSGEEKTEAGTGYFKKQIPGRDVQPDMGNIEVVLSSANGQPPTANRQPSTINRQPPTVSPSWGAIYWQYFEDMDKITAAQTPLSVIKNLFIEKNSDKGPVLEAVSESNLLKPGDKLKMRIIIKSDRDLEYVHLKDMRAACLEPANVLSGYQWQDGLGYYQTTQDASTSFFFDRLPKGTYVFEYPVFVTTAGKYSNGISSLECMYAPEFGAHSEGIRIRVESK